MQILHDIDITVEAGEIVGLVGANAAGKSTLMFSLAGLRTHSTGAIFIGDLRIDALPAYERVAQGLVLVPERRRLFPFMTVLENLEIGAYSAPARPARRKTLDQVYQLLPVLVRAPEPGRRIAQWRRAADAGDRPCTDGQAACPAARRADRRPRATLCAACCSRSCAIYATSI